MTDTVLQTVSLLASLASLILAVIAIWLSITFFKMSSKMSDQANDAAKGIAASVDRLESLFDKLYADTFSMMRETVTDMRKHFWPEEPGETDIAEEARSLTEEKLKEVRERIDAELERVLARQQIADDKLESLQTETRRLIGRAVDESRQAEAEAREETLRDRIVLLLRESGGSAPAESVVNRLAHEVTMHRVLDELNDMHSDHLVKLHGRLGPQGQIRGSTRVHLVTPPSSDP